MSTLINTFKQSQIYKEVAENTRLQWMLVGICFILVVSLSKSMVDKVDELDLVRQADVKMYARLQSASTATLDEAELAEGNNRLAALISAFSPASSSSTAEARALQDLDKIVANLVRRKRLNLVGSSPASFGAFNGWSVRIEVNGALEPERFTTLLEKLDMQHPSIRVASMQYSPAISNQLNLVVDMMYRSSNAQ